MLERELLPAERLDGTEHLVGVRARRHREHQFVDQPGRLRASAPADLLGGTCFLEIEIPVFG